MREKIRAQLILHEGLRLKPYKDTVGKLSIGIGRNLDDVGITPDEAKLLLEHDINRAIEAARALAHNWPISEVRQRVLIDMAFNLGRKKLGMFKNFLAAVELSLWDLAAKEMRNSTWYKQVGARAERLARMMETGEDYES